MKLHANRVHTACMKHSEGTGKQRARRYYRDFARKSQKMTRTPEMQKLLDKIEEICMQPKRPFFGALTDWLFGV